MIRGKGKEHNEAAKDLDGKKDRDHLRAAQGKQKQGREAAQEQSKRRSAAEEHRKGGSSTAERAERNGSLKGLQGNASLPMKGGNVHLNMSNVPRSARKSSMPMVHRGWGMSTLTCGSGRSFTDAMWTSSPCQRPSCALSRNGAVICTSFTRTRL